MGGAVSFKLGQERKIARGSLKVSSINKAKESTAQTTEENILLFYFIYLLAYPLTYLLTKLYSFKLIITLKTN